MLISSSFIVDSNPSTSYNKNSTDIEQKNIPNCGQQEHIWPMYKDDPQHTGRSSYDTSDNLGGERWKYYIDSGLTEPAVIDKDGILYVPSDVEGFHAVYPKGSRKWKQDLMGLFGYVPAIDPDGTIKWEFLTEATILISPAIDNNGIVYIASDDGYLYAIFSNNGARKWRITINSLGGCSSSPLLGMIWKIARQ